jgi:hypothetical protein
LMRSDDKNRASFKNVTLLSATVTGQIDMSGVNIDGDLDADGLEVGGSLLMRSDDKNRASFQNVNLSAATVKGEIDMDGASFGGDISGQRLGVASDFSIRNIAAGVGFAIPFAQLGGNLDLGGAKLAGLDLRGVSIVGEMRLGDRNSSVVWFPLVRKTDVLDLRNTHVGSLADNRDSWPDQGRLHLDGFTFARLGGFEGDSVGEMVGRGAQWWDRHWARLDNDFSASPYEQLAAAFTAAGDHNAADEIRYREQVRADEKNTSWAYVRSGLMRWFAGYGIGSYMFRALGWALGLSALGAVILRFRVKGVAEAGHGSLWCFGASVNRLLPVINLRKEFTDFFDDPARNKFTPRQDFFFTILSVLGWVLGAIVLAAMATITHGP